MSTILRSIADAQWFQNTVTAAILFAGVLVGIETYPLAVERWGGVLHLLDTIVLGIFIIEISVKMGAEGSKPWRYFFDAWNVFDFVIVAAVFVPGLGQYAIVLRLLRLLRVLKLVKAIPKLQVLVGALLASIPSMFYVSLLLFMLFYIYAVAAVFLFGANDPVHFENLQMSFLSLFRAVTLEDWTDLMYINMYGCADYGYEGNALCTASKAQPALAVAFFVSFVLIGTMVVLNLFIGVIMNGMDEARSEADQLEKEERRESEATMSLETEMEQLAYEMAAAQERMLDLHKRLGARLEKDDRIIAE
ncbi:MAG: voltage-gated sodium channel [Flavobacteriales bacterium]|jgi:voltage-gated sodium channel